MRFTAFPYSSCRLGFVILLFLSVPDLIDAAVALSLTSTMENTWELFEKMITELVYIVPQLKQWKSDHPICASNLKLKSASLSANLYVEGTFNLPSNLPDAHFIGVSLPETQDFPLDNVYETIITVLSSIWKRDRFLKKQWSTRWQLALLGREPEKWSRCTNASSKWHCTDVV